jgi:3-oxoacyl-[acyl-carrier protein] reductase|tara:strand:- start:24 stop:827 length:804 start_codon:yes stop_codon:yes gene_type:complete
MFKNLDNKVAIVTGAGQGIGKGVAKVFAKAGAKVVVASRSPGNSQKTVDEIWSDGGDAIMIQMDCGKREEITRVVAETVAHYGRLDIVIHNAAVFPMFAAEEFPDDQLDACLNVNFKPCIWFTQEAVPHFRKVGGGRFIFTSSVTGPRVSMPLTTAYVASKGAMNAYIKTASLEHARENITFNCVEPGFIKTQAMAILADEKSIVEMESYIPQGKMGEPEDIAYCMLYLASEEASYVTAQTIAVDGGSCLPESPVQIREYYEEKGFC